MTLLAGRSIAVRLAVSSLFWSSLILLVAGLILTTLSRRSIERSFDELLLVYANDLAADLVPGAGEEDGREGAARDVGARDVGARADPRFDIPLSGWYWQIARADTPAQPLKSSRSLLGNSLPPLTEAVANRDVGAIRKANVGGPESRELRILERDIDLGEEGRFLVRVAGPADEISGALYQFVAALALTSCCWVAVSGSRRCCRSGSV